MVLTRLVIVPDGESAVSKRIEKEIRKDFPAAKWAVKNWRNVKEPHLPIKSGMPYWVTLEEITGKNSRHDRVSEDALDKGLST